MQALVVRLRASGPPIVPPEQIDAFLRLVIQPHISIRDSHERFFDAIKKRPVENGGLGEIGNICFNAAEELAQVYPQYAASTPLAERALREEVQRNAAFEFLMKVHNFIP